MNTSRTRREVSPLLYTATLLLLALSILAVSVARAAPVPPPPGFLPDTGESYFGHDDETMAFEIAELIPVTIFGFYFASDPGTLVPVFDSFDDPGDTNEAIIDFDLGPTFGGVYDVEKAEYQAVFASSMENIGFYLTIGGSTTIYSDPLLNGGLDLFSAFQTMGDPLRWMFIFEGVGAAGLVPIQANIVTPLTPASLVPLPPAIFLMGSFFPLLVFMSRRRRKAAVS